MCSHFSSTHPSLPAQHRHTFLCGCSRLWWSLLLQSSNSVLLGACLDFLEFTSRQGNGGQNCWLSLSPIFWLLCSCILSRRQHLNQHQVL